MAIWKLKISTTIVTERNSNTMTDYLGIEFLEIGDDFITARMPVNAHTRQPLGIMHGGASCVLAETLGSVAANFCVEEGHYCVGLDINTNHIRSVRDGYVIGRATPYHIGRSTQVWAIEIRDEEGKLVSINRLTMAVLKSPA
jgi:1,4-dihydroxy-2-naphthoyl-CoA hydrolase